MAVRANKPAFNIREKLKELTHSIGLKGRELMSAATTQDARDLVSAGRKNIVINGDMRIAQRGTSATSAGSGFIFNTIDRLMTRNNGSNTARYTNTQSTDSPGLGGFKYSYKLEVTTAKGTLNSNQYQGVSTRIEGQNLQHLCFGTSNAKSTTLSFWVKSNTTGQYSCHISNWNNSRNISRPYTINTANDWEKKTITIPGDTTTVIPNDTGIGFEIGWCLATTSFYNDGTDGGVWHATSDAGKRHSGQVVEFGGTIGDTWYLAGVQLEVGKNATEFEHRSYGEELALCQRYFYNFAKGETYNIIANGFANTSTNALFHFQHPVPMRTVPTTSGISGSWQVIDGQSHNVSSFSAATDATISTARVDASTSGLTIGRGCMLRNNNDVNATFGFVAEL
jgi:hypothetical protein